MEPIKSYLRKEGWERDWEKTKSHIQVFGRRLCDFLDGGVAAGNAAQKKALLDFMDSMERRAIAYNFQLAREGKVLTSEGVVVVRPDLAYPHIYAVTASEPLETRISNINDFYR